jgi:cytochrome c-type biogenesis protein CcmH
VISRRNWLQSIAGAAVGAGTLAARGSLAQQSQAGIADTSNLFAMDQSAARSVRLPAKPNATPSMSPEDRDAVEHRIRCQCGCTMDIYLCRTTDFTCSVSPAMHRDVMSLVQGGYSAQEILDAFVNVYGERVLMAPPKVGFNILGYVVPGIAIFVGAIVLAVVIRRWKRPPQLARRTERAGSDVSPLPVDATPQELARLEAAIRGSDDA